MPIRIALAALTFLLLTVAPVRAQYEWTSSRPDGHAPIGIMGDHIHERGEYMLFYRLMHMNMDGNRTGTSEVSTSDVHRDFMVAPLDMTMTMHMVGVMYAPSDAITLMGGAKWIDKGMNHVTRMTHRWFVLIGQISAEFKV